MEKLKTFADRLQFAIRHRGTTQVAVARRAKISKSAVNQMASSTTQWPSGEHVFAIADELAFEARWLLTGKGPRTKEEAAEASLSLEGLPDYAKAAVKAVRDKLAAPSPDSKAG